MKLNIFTFVFGIFLISCKGKETSVEPYIGDCAMEFTESDKGDSIFYFKNFDLYSFKGIDKQNSDSLKYPFVKMIYRNDSLTLKAHYNESKSHELKLFKLNSHWCHHWSHWSDGVTSHFFIFFSDTALYEFRFLRNPYGSTQEDKVKPATFYSVTKEIMEENIITAKYYKSFNWGSSDYTEVPKISETSEADWEKNCQSFIVTKKEIENDTIVQSYQSYERIFRDGKYREFETDGRLSVSKIPLIFNSEFYTRFLKMGN